ALGEPSPEFKVDAAPEGTSSVGVPACEGASVGVAACVLTLRGARGVVASRQTRRAYGSRDGRRCCVRGSTSPPRSTYFWQASDRAQGAEAVLSEPQLGTQRFPARTGDTAPAERQWGLRGVGDHMSCSGPCPDARLPHVASARLRRLGRRTDSHPLRGATSSSQRRLGASSRIVEPSDSSGVRLSHARTAYLARVRARNEGSPRKRFAFASHWRQVCAAPASSPFRGRVLESVARASFRGLDGHRPAGSGVCSAGASESGAAWG
ncbi:hypothetical protein B0H10DRAFT_2082469, partial [Mycena sp. CBHHK59/15]